jgi:hypothetical protein
MRTNRNEAPQIAPSSARRASSARVNYLRRFSRLSSFFLRARPQA